LNAQLSRVGSTATGGGGFSNLSRNLRTIGSQAKTVGTDLTLGLTAPLVGIGAAVFAAGSDFEHSFTQVKRTVDGLDDTQLQELRQSLLDMSKTEAGGGKTASELAEIAATGGQLGLAGQEIKSFTSLVARLSLATNLPVDAISEDVGRSIKVMGLAEDKYEAFGSTVAELGNIMGGTEADIFEFSRRLAATLGALGVRPEQILAIGSALAEAGVNPEAGATAINKFFVEMVNSLNDTSEASDEAKQKLQSLKDSVSDLAGSLEVAELRQREFGRNTPASVVKANEIAIAKYRRELVQANTKLGDFADTGILGKFSIAGMAKVANVGEDAFRDLVKTDPASAFAAFVAGLQGIAKAGGPAALTKTLEELGITEERQREALLALAKSEKSLPTALEGADKAWSEAGSLAKEITKAFKDLNNELQLLKNRAQVVLIDQFDKNRESMQKSIDKLNELVVKFDEFSKSVPALSNEQLAIFGILIALGPVVSILGSILQITAALVAIAGAPIAAGIFVALAGLPLAFDAIANHWERTKSIMDQIPQLRGIAFLIDFVKKHGDEIKSDLLDIVRHIETTDWSKALGNGLIAIGEEFSAFGDFLSQFFDQVLLPILLRFKGWVMEHILGAIIGLLQGLQQLGITSLPGVGDIGQTIGNLQAQQSAASAVAGGTNIDVTINNPQVTSKALLDQLGQRVGNALVTAMVNSERAAVVPPQPLPGQTPGTPF
jgi:hypothetical protein